METAPARSPQPHLDHAFTIPTALPSGRQLKRRPRGFRGRDPGTAWRRKFESELVPIVPPSARCTWPVELRIIRIIAYAEDPYDKDNLYWGSKPLIDALGAMGYIPSIHRKDHVVIARDDPAWVTLYVEQRRAGPAEPAPAIQVEIRRRVRC